MKFEKTISFIEEKIKELLIPYFNIIVTKDNEKVFSYRYSKHNDNNDLLTMYSMTKVITSVAFMQLYEKKLLDPEDEVAKYLNGYDNLKLLDGTNVKNKIKIKHLLTMTAGLDYDLNRPAILKVLKDDKDASTIKICEAFAKDGLLFEPGSNFNYSLCLDVVGAIIEKVTKMPFCDYVEENIFKPLGMKNSSLKTDLNLFRKTVPDEYFLDGKMHVLEKDKPLINLSKNYSSGGASLTSTVEDYSKFLVALLSKKIISEESIKIMSFPYIKETPFCLPVQKYSISSFDYGYGYGVRVRQVASPHGMPIGEFGWDGAAGSYCFCDPVNNVTIVIGLSVWDWPSYIKDLHIKIVEHVYDELADQNLIKQ